MNARRGRHSDNLPPLVLVVTVIFGTVRILRSITPPFGRMVAEQAKFEGILRFVCECARVCVSTSACG